MKNVFFVFATLFICVVAGDTLQAQIPRTLSYQGVLTDNAGKPRPDGSYTFTFRFYTSPTGGTAIWSESKSLPVKNGLFSTVLGEQTPFGAAVKFDKQYWLGIQVGNEPELSPRIALTSVGYSLSSLRADTAMVAMATSADTTWRHKGSNIYRLNGNVGIGTASPGYTLDVLSTATMIRSLSETNNSLYLNSGSGTGSGAISTIYFQTGGVTQGYIQSQQNNKLLELGANGVTRMTIDASGTTIYSPSATNNRLYLNSASGTGPGAISTIYFQTGGVTQGYIQSQQNNKLLELGTNGATRMTIDATGNVGIGLTNSATAKLEIAGRTKTQVLEITGGSDLAEPFEISENQPIPKGALVIIDEENPGQLKLSHQAYDKRVAGVVSGAGGINPGLTLTQEGVMEGGQNVALSGRVYALATAANGPIKPGDLLTTSDVSGHAMKATDRERWDGAIIGKAMSVLEKGEGLVLVLVNLQ